MDAIIYTIISNHYATYVEIRDKLTIDETLNLYEACLVNLHNKAVLTNEINERSRKNGSHN